MGGSIGRVEGGAEDGTKASSSTLTLTHTPRLSRLELPPLSDERCAGFRTQLTAMYNELHERKSPFALLIDIRNVDIFVLDVGRHLHEARTLARFVGRVAVVLSAESTNAISLGVIAPLFGALSPIKPARVFVNMDEATAWAWAFDTGSCNRPKHAAKASIRILKDIRREMVERPMRGAGDTSTMRGAGGEAVRGPGDMMRGAGDAIRGAGEAVRGAGGEAMRGAGDMIRDAGAIVRDGRDGLLGAVDHSREGLLEAVREGRTVMQEVVSPGCARARPRVGKHEHDAAPDFAPALRVWKLWSPTWEGSLLFGAFRDASDATPPPDFAASEVEPPVPLPFLRMRHG